MCKRWILYLSILVVSGCTMAPRYERPGAPVAGEWPDKGANEAVVGPVKEDKTAVPSADIGWKEFFKDPKLQQLIELSLKNNRNLRIAALNVQKARAQYRIQRAELFPALDMTAGGSAQRIPKDLSGTGSVTTAHQYDVGLGFTSYELDLFGRIQSLKNQTLEQYLSLSETRISTQLTLVSEVANAYLTLLTDQGLLKITRDTLSSQRESYDIEKQRAAQGIGTELDVRQAETSVREAESNIARYTRQVGQDLNALTLLVGQPLPETLLAEIAKITDGPDDSGVLTELAPGLPSDLLTRRPDIRAAEHDLKAANANIGAARAAFFPSIILTGGIGTSSQSLSGLFAGGQNVWNFAPVIRLPIFDGGVNAGTLDAAKISKNIEIARYEYSIQTAFREVSDTLVARATLNDQLKADQLFVEAARESYRLYEMRYNTGVDNYINVLIWHRQLYTAQQGLLNTRLLRLSNLVTLYKALGGGWTEQTPPVGLKAQAGLRSPEKGESKITAN